MTAQIDNSSHQRVPSLLIFGIFLTLLSGRADIPGMEIGARFILLIVTLFLFGLWKSAIISSQFQSSTDSRRWGAVPKSIVAFFSLYLISAVWANQGARLGEVSANALLILLCVMMLSEMASYSPERVREVFTYCMFWAGVLFALASFVSGETSGIGRATAFGGGPNVFVRVMVWGAIAAITITLLTSKTRYLLALPILALFGALSGSRGGISAAVISAVIMMLILGLARRIRAIYAVWGILVASLIMWLTWSNNRFRFLLERRFSWDAIVESGYGSRDPLWQASLQIFHDSALFGAGMDSFFALAYNATGFPYPHNIILEIGEDLGVLGLGLFVIVLLTVIGNLVLRKVDLTTLQFGMLSAGIFTLFASMFSGDIFDSRFLWVFFTLAFPISQKSSIRSSLEPESTGSRAIYRKASQ